jgi:hypothetical protein
MHYELNVSKRGARLFATAPQSFPDEERALAVFADLIGRFPANEGYEVTLTRCDTISTRVAHRSPISVAESGLVPNAVTVDGVTHVGGEPGSDITVCGLTYTLNFEAFPRRAVVTCAKCLARTKERW